MFFNVEALFILMNIDMKVLFALLIGSFCVSASILAQDQYSQIGFDAPVSVAQYGGFFYLSNSGENFGLDVKDGDGYISRVRSDGSQQEVTMKYISGLNNPRGIYIIDGTLYVCDIDRLVGFDLRSRNKVFELSFEKEKVTQLTSITTSDEKTLYISATDINTIFEVNIAKKRYSKWTETTAPTGLLINNNQMYVTSMGTDSLPNGKLGVIDMRTKKYTQIIEEEGYYWGMSLQGKRLYYSDWIQFGKRGAIKWVDLDTKETGRVNLTSRIGGPAEFFYDARNDIFFIPAVLEGSVFACMGFIKK